ncbi:MAG TPA: SDR family NAD(P)-dependent oxidoreductase, partial [Burkholderiaceae bacterium]|nr:SDR family NAD(P)-dependent oxidoreductase [Burkholderiaceae bacterium]
MARIIESGLPVPEPFEAAYAASKSALMVFGDSLRVELDGAAIGVTILNPAVVDTRFFDRRGVP